MKKLNPNKMKVRLKGLIVRRSQVYFTMMSCNSDGYLKMRNKLSILDNRISKLIEHGIK